MRNHLRAASLLLSLFITISGNAGNKKAIVITLQPVNVSVQAGGICGFQTYAIGPGIGYQWQVNYDGTWHDLNEGGGYSGTHTGGLTYRIVSSGSNGNLYRCVFTEYQTGATDTSATAVLTVTTP
jgi:hypothetical protein